MANPTTLPFHPSPLVAAIGRLHAAGIRPEHFNPLWRLRAAFLGGRMAIAPQSPVGALMHELHALGRLDGYRVRRG